MTKLKQAERGTIFLARKICAELEGATEEDALEKGRDYSSRDAAEILSAEVVRLRELPLYPVFELLETRILEGFYIKHQDDIWWLFNPEGNAHCWGKTLREMFVNLILVDA